MYGKNEVFRLKMTVKSKRKLVVFASTFPRCQESMILEHDQETMLGFLTWKDDTLPMFVYESGGGGR